jgi:hypothetical protein
MVSSTCSFLLLSCRTAKGITVAMVAPAAKYNNNSRAIKPYFFFDPELPLGEGLHVNVAILSLVLGESINCTNSMHFVIISLICPCCMHEARCFNDKILQDFLIGESAEPKTCTNLSESES